MIEGDKNRRSEDLTKSLIFAGERVNLLPEVLLRLYSSRISYELSKHPSTMLQYSSGELYESMKGSRSVVAINESTEDLLGFGQIWPYADKVWEFGSWISYIPGIGRPILFAGSLTGHEVDPKAQIIAIVEESNNKAQKSIIKSGGVLIGSKYSDKLINPGNLEPAEMNIYDMSWRIMIPKPKLVGPRLLIDPENYQLPLDL